MAHTTGDFENAGDKGLPPARRSPANTKTPVVMVSGAPVVVQFLVVVSTLAATSRQRGNNVHHRRLVKDGADVGGLTRACACAQSNEDGEVNLLVVAPPPNGRRSLAGGEAERQSSQVNGAA
jgi:hypothetical protein